MHATPVADLLTPLRELFGHERFLPGQEDILHRALAGRDTLALMPTGSGKSLPYQLAAMLRPSPTLVVSPLIALMKDQVDALPAPVARAASVINSSLEPGEANRRLEAFEAGEIKLLLAAPERLRQRAFVSALERAGVGLVVIDEVHCVSLWGHDFRPDYLFIRSALAALGDPPVLGLTATATPATEVEIGAALGRELDVVRASVVRPNLRHRVDRAEDEEERRRALLAHVVGTEGPAIVYARSRKKCEELSRLLVSHGVRARHYHAGLEAAERTAAQEAFLGGDVRVVVATTAFGMGIDKPDIRLVLLFNIPGSLEDYVQMVGRAGRDGEPSACVLLAGRRDAAELHRFVRADVPSPEALRSVLRALRRCASDGVATVSPAELAGTDDSEVDPRVLVGMLEHVGLARRGFDAGRALQVELLPPPEGTAERVATLLAGYEERARTRAERIAAYAESTQCRQIEIAEHFGEELGERCGTCDRCTSRAEVGVEAWVEEESRSLPDDVAGSLLAAVGRLRWPLGERGLAAMLAGSVSAPPSARRSGDFGLLAAARPGTIKRWIGALVESGHLCPYESEEGYRLLRLARTDDPPRLNGAAPRAADEAPGELTAEESALFERLRTWRWERAQAAEAPAFTILSDRTLRALAVERPASAAALGAVHGIGPAKLERYGEEILALIGASGH